jgi:hypothetical protein
VLAKFAEVPPEPSTAAGLTRDALLNRRDVLAFQLSSATARQLELELLGEPVIGHSVRVDFLSGVLKSLQEAVAAVGQAVGGAVTKTGVVPKRIREATSLRLVGTFAGSFGVKLEGPQVMWQAPLFPDENHSPELFDEVVGMVLDVVNAATEDDPEASIRDHAAPLGIRAVHHLQELAGTLTSVDRAQFRWRLPDGEGRSVTLSRLSAEQLYSVLGSTDLSEEEIHVAGRLVGASLVRSRFELETKDGSVLNGRVDAGLVGTLSRFFDADCVATLRVAIARSKVDEEISESYVLVGIE